MCDSVVKTFLDAAAHAILLIEAGIGVALAAR